MEVFCRGTASSGFPNGAVSTDKDIHKDTRQGVENRQSWNGIIWSSMLRVGGGGAQREAQPEAERTEARGPGHSETGATRPT